MKSLREIMNTKNAEELTVGEATIGSCVVSLAITTAMAIPVVGFFGACWAIDKIEEFKKKKAEEKKTEENEN